MKIKIKSFLTLKKMMGGQGSLKMEVEAITLRELLEELSRRFGQGFRDMVLDPESMSRTGHFQILINGRNYRHFAGQIDTELKDGDEISIFPLIAGG